MKILLDECVTKKLKNYLSDYDVFTVTEMSWSGIKNRKLMSFCIENNFDILLTIDKNLAFQQNLDKYKLTVVVFNSQTSKIEELILFIPSFQIQLPSFEKHKSYLLEK